METKVLKPSESALTLAAGLLREGKLVGIPTETVYGLGADALNPEAVKRIFEAKGRPGDNPLIVHIAGADELDALISVEPSENARKLMEAFWPGPLTLIFPRAERVPLCTTGGPNTVAVRMPSHPVARELISKSGLAIAAPSGEEDEYLTRDSLKFHSRMGYEFVGKFKHNGHKFGRWYNLVWMEKHIGKHAADMPRPKSTALTEVGYGNT